MGLLDMGGAQPQQPQGGLLGAMQGEAAPKSSSAGLQMAMALAADPTPETARKILSQLKADDNPETDQFEQILAQLGDDPAKLKELAEFVIQRLSKSA